MPNKNNNDLWRNSLFLIGGFLPIPIFDSCMNLAKMQIPQLSWSYLPFVVFVWRQLEFAFFGALTSVGALFYFQE